MRASVNDAISLRGSSGTARVVDLISAALSELGHQVERLRPQAAGSNKVVNAVRATEWDLHGFDRQARGDLLISPTNVGLARPGRPHLLWVHDTMVLDHPSWFDRAYAAHARLTFGPSARRATAVATSSHDARRRMTARWPFLEDRTHVVPWPATGEFAPVRAVVPPSLTVLMLGATEPHKRHLVGVEAVRMLRLVTGVDVRLHVVGPEGRAEAALQRRLGIVDPTGRWTQRSSYGERTEVDRALGEAWLLLQCSLDEGFCLPLVEAAQHALPALHTGAGAMVEVHPPGDCRSAEPLVVAERMAKLLEPTAYAAASAASLAVSGRQTWASFTDDLQVLVERLLTCG